MSSVQIRSTDVTPPVADESRFRTPPFALTPVGGPSRAAMPLRPLPAFGARGLAAGVEVEAADDDAVFDLARLRTLAGFPLRAARRRRRLAGGICGATTGLALLAALLLPRTYHVETRILAQRNVVMPLLGNPRRAVPTESDAPTRLAAEAVLRRENLVQVAKETDLLRHWSEIRSPAGRAKEAILSLVRRPAPDSERVEAIVDVLESRLTVQTATEASDGTVTIGVDWPEPHSALAIVRAAEQNFLDQRRASELERIAESIAILERYVGTAQAGIETAVGELEPLTARAGARATRAGAVASAVTAPAAPDVSGSTASERDDLEAALAAKETVVKDLEVSRARRVGELRTQLTTLQERYGGAHPEVQAAEDRLAAIGGESPQLDALKADARAMRSRLQALGGGRADAAGAPRFAASRDSYAQLASATLARARQSLAPDDPRLTYAESRLKIATADYEDLLDRLEGARIELETARAAFKYRYSVLDPAQLPKRPVKPNPALLVLAGLIGGAVLALFGATAADVASGRALEPWQVERGVGLPVLARVRRA